MPYPFAHPAAAVPLARPLGRWGYLPALVVGSLAADLPRLAWLPVERAASHSLLGWLWFCIPAGVLATMLFHGFLRRPLTHLAPEALRRRLPDPPSGPRDVAELSLVALVVSVAAGSATHLLLDLVTHTYSPVVQGSELLQSTLLTLGRWRLQLFNLLQHGGSLVMVALLVWWVWRWLRRQEPGDDPASGLGPGLRGVVWLFLGGIPLVAAVIGAWPQMSSGPSLSAAILSWVHGGRAVVAVAGPVILALALAWPLVERIVASGEGS